MDTTLRRVWKQTVRYALAASGPLSLLGLFALAAASLFLSLYLSAPGAPHMLPTQVFDVIAGHLHGISSDAVTTQQAAALWTLRLPRALVALFAGAGLGLAAATMQGLFRHPLADPALAGSSAGGVTLAASLCAAMHVWPDAPSGSLIATCARILGATAALFAVYKLSVLRGRALTTTMLLMGLAVNAFGLATTDLISYLSRAPDFSAGALGRAGWPQVIACASPMVLVGLALAALAPRLDALHLGDQEASHLGVDTNRTRFYGLLLVAMAVGAASAAVGVVAFLGLMGAHLSRQLVGARHRLLLPGSALLGAALLLLADVVSRFAAQQAEVSVGVITTLMGAPFFFTLLVHERARLGAS